MNKQQFINELKNALNRREDITEDMILSELPEWDSLGIVCVITMLEDDFNYKINISELEQIKTLKDLIEIKELSISDL